MPWFKLLVIQSSFLGERDEISLWVWVAKSQAENWNSPGVYGEKDLMEQNGTENTVALRTCCGALRVQNFIISLLASSAKDSEVSQMS